MSPDKLPKFKKLLEELAAEIREDLGKNREDSGTVKLDTSIGRLARMDAMQSQQMALELKRRKEQRLQRIAKALEAVHAGTYGTCRRCQKPINEERLEYQPDAILCIECAEG